MFFHWKEMSYLLSSHYFYDCVLSCFSTQLYFVKKASKKMLGNTHLVIKEAGGSKYEAALKWNLHAVKTE